MITSGFHPATIQLLRLQSRGRRRRMVRRFCEPRRLVLSAIACILALREGFVPPTIHLNDPDPECDLNYTPNRMVQADLTHALTTSLGFGGHNACLALTRTEGR